MRKDEILVLYGQHPKEMAKTLCQKAGLAEMIGSKKSVGLKPNLVSATLAEEGATTHPEVVAGVIEYLQENGDWRLQIMEGSWVGGNTKAAYKKCGYEALSSRYGVPLVDLQQDSAVACDCADMQISICKSALDVDFMINLPVHKGHCQTLVTCALKNNKGVITNAEKRRFHTMGLHKPIAHLNTVARNDFILVDGICGDLDFEEGGNPVQADRLFAAADPVLCDAYAARQMGISVSEVPYIGMAEALGVGSANLAAARVTELNTGQAAGASARAAGKARRLGQCVREDSACSACYAAVVRGLSRLDEATLARLPGVCVGQGWQGKTGQLGIGRCTAKFQENLPGCPPAAADVVAFLTKVAGNL